MARQTDHAVFPCIHAAFDCVGRIKSNVLHLFFGGFTAAKDATLRLVPEDEQAGPDSHR